MKDYGTLTEAVKHMNKKELTHQLLTMNEVWKDYEEFLNEKLGTGKVESLFKEFVLWKLKFVIPKEILEKAKAEDEEAEEGKADV